MKKVQWNVFETKIKCNVCGEVIKPISNNKWKECSCGETKVKGKGMFRMIQGKDYTDLTTSNFNKVPPHKEWDSKE